ncbi:alpha/beta hydrolase [Glycomyces tarimensis]
MTAATDDDTEQHTPHRRRLLRRLGKVTDEPRPFWRGAAVMLALATAAAVAWSVGDQYLPGTGLVLASQTAINVLIAVAASGLVTGILLVTVGRFKALAWGYVWTLGACLILLFTLGAGASMIAWFAAIAVIVVGASLLGGALGALLPHAGRDPVKVRDRRILALALSLVVLVAPTVWVLTASQGNPAPADDGTAMTVIENDPASQGPFEVAKLTYGSGIDRRQAYGESADLETPMVDASQIVTGWDEQRESLWGFDIEHLPVNGKVWYPEGQGPFPLVLMVHGNKSSVTESEDGFAYLGELLASRGFITASIDQNFFNTGPLDRSGGLTGVNVARGWMLLEHLRVWDEWNRGGETPFTGAVDMENVGLIGHSRGGEAIAVAAHLNGLDSLPGDDAVPLDYDFGIRSLLALAPSDGQYLPEGDPIRLEDVNYLVIQGSHDADVTSFAGLNQYERVSFSGDGEFLKAALYVGHANHGHFNSRWGSRDVGNGIPKLFIDTETLIAPEDQRRVAEVYASSFLRATLAEDSSDMGVLRNYRTASAFLPETEYVNQFTDSATTEAATVAESGFASSETIALPLRSGPGEDSVRSLEWESGGEEPTLTVEAPFDASANLVFDAVAMTEGTELADAVSVRLTDRSGASAELPLIEFMPLKHRIPGQYLKAEWMHGAALTEPVLQTYTVPLDAFESADADLADLEAVSLVFDGSRSGAVLIDDFGLAPAER